MGYAKILGTDAGKVLLPIRKSIAAFNLMQVFTEHRATKQA
jgi:hypothetical protein